MESGFWLVHAKLQVLVEIPGDVSLELSGEGWMVCKAMVPGKIPFEESK